jgi:tetratricopeptide (TPR) repeat protein
MKSLFVLMLIPLTFSCIHSDADINFPNDAREEYQKIAQQSNAKTIKWQLKEERLIYLGEISLDSAISYRDSLMNKDKSLSNFERSIIDCIMGEILIQYEQFQEALEYFNKSLKNDGDSPRLQLNRAICYVKLGNIDEAFLEIKKATQHNHYFLWYLGNLYELIGDKEKAIEQYDFLYKKNKEYYTYCKERIDYLKQDDAILYTEIIHDFQSNYGYVILN